MLQSSMVLCAKGSVWPLKCSFSSRNMGLVNWDKVTRVGLLYFDMGVRVEATHLQVASNWGTKVLSSPFPH
ncbi:hypothetical protein GOODEAATRI_034219 [Goodea atripinnis]|uniref:Uncharacterized protein n=1 Tax=Goodea atripinnis TaxID=208336 RepID=A0ABV0PTW9_9TELE